MKFARIFQAVHFQPWLITSRGHASVRELLERRLEFTPLSDRPTQDVFGNELPVMQIQDGIAIIPINGVIGKGLGSLEKSCGAVGVEDVSADIQAAVMDKSVKAILLDISSPGGTVGGVPNLADLIAEATKYKKVIAYSDSEMASAAYWLASSANLIYADMVSDVGSIGVYIPWVDQSAAFAMEGYKVDLIKNAGGKYKGMGYPGTSLTPEQRDQMQKSVDQIFSMFQGHVLMNRPKIKEEAMQGQTFLGDEALSVGLIDGVATREEVMQMLSEYVNAS
jgi:signal peptide peptidase SppA